MPVGIEIIIVTTEQAMKGNSVSISIGLLIRSQSLKEPPAPGVRDIIGI